MADIEISVDAGTSKRLLTAGKYCDRDILVSASGGAAEPVIQPLEVTANGVYNVPAGVDGYNPVSVNVSGGGTETGGSIYLNYTTGVLNVFIIRNSGSECKYDLSYSYSTGDTINDVLYICYTYMSGSPRKVKVQGECEELLFQQDVPGSGYDGYIYKINGACTLNMTLG